MEKPFGVVREYIQAKETQDLLACMSKLESMKTEIDSGGNAEVFTLENSDFSGICVKKIRKNPRYMANSICTGPHS
jgi:hypothetical protein